MADDRSTEELDHQRRKEELRRKKKEEKKAEIERTHRECWEEEKVKEKLESREKKKERKEKLAAEREQEHKKKKVVSSAPKGEKKSKPDPPQPAFKFFCDDHKEMTPEQQKEAWRSLDEAGKEPYKAQAAADKERHAKEMEEYKARKEASEKAGKKERRRN